MELLLINFKKYQDVILSLVIWFVYCMIQKSICLNESMDNRGLFSDGLNRCKEHVYA